MVMSFGLPFFPVADLIQGSGERGGDTSDFFIVAKRSCAFHEIIRSLLVIWMFWIRPDLQRDIPFFDYRTRGSLGDRMTCR